MNYSAYGTLTVRVLLDTIEHCMKEFDFPDPYLFVSFRKVYSYVYSCIRISIKYIFNYNIFLIF